MITTINEFKKLNENLSLLTPDQLKGRSEMKAYFIDRLLQGPATIGELTFGAWQNASKFRYTLIENNIIEVIKNPMNNKITYDFTIAYKTQHNLA